MTLRSRPKPLLDYDRSIGPAEQWPERRPRVWSGSCHDGRDARWDIHDGNGKGSLLNPDEIDRCYSNLREATDRQIEQERKKRQEIEDRKRQELADERSKLTDWQKGLGGVAAPAGGAADDDSDYEEEETVVEAAAAAPAEQPMADHPDYHGKGWQSSG